MDPRPGAGFGSSSAERSPDARGTTAAAVLRTTCAARLRASASPRLRVSASPRLRVSASPRLRVSASPRLRVSASSLPQADPRNSGSMTLPELRPRQPFAGLAIAATLGILAADRWLVPPIYLIAVLAIGAALLPWRPGTIACWLFTALAF